MMTMHDKSSDWCLHALTMFPPSVSGNINMAAGVAHSRVNSESAHDLANSAMSTPVMVLPTVMVTGTVSVTIALSVTMCLTDETKK